MGLASDQVYMDNCTPPPKNGIEQVIQYTKIYGTVPFFSFQFHFPFYSHLFSMFISKTAFYNKQSDIFSEKIAHEILRSLFSVS